MSQTTARRPELDVLRFVAFFAVFLHHVGEREVDASAGLLARIGATVTQAFGFGLTLFFVLSAFLITRLLLAEARAAGRIDLLRFWLRRGLRIWPLYVVGLAIGWLFVASPVEASMLRWFSVFGGNLFFFQSPWNHNPMTPLWSLSAEEQFYVLLPLLLVALGAARAGLIGLAGIGLGIAGLWVLGSAHAWIDTTIWSSPAASLLAFGAGVMLAAETAERRLALPTGVRIGLIVAALLGFALAAGVFDAKACASARSGELVVAGHLSAVAACVALVVAAASGPLRAPRFVAELGRISYGLYVFHLLGLHFAEALVGPSPVARPLLGLAITIVLAALSDRVLEQPFLRLRDRLSASAPRAARVA